MEKTKLIKQKYTYENKIKEYKQITASNASPHKKDLARQKIRKYKAEIKKLNLLIYD